MKFTRSLKKLSLGTKLAIFFILAQIFIASALSLVAISHMRVSLISQKKSQLENSGAILASALLPDIFNNEFLDMQMQLDKVIESDPT